MRFLYFALVIVILILSWHDIRFYRLPNFWILAMVILRLSSPILDCHIYAQILMGLQIGIFFLAIKLAFTRFLRKPTLGWGDVKLAAACGMWLSYATLPYFLITTGINGIFCAILWQYLYKNPYFPLGPSMGIGLLMTLGLKNAYIL